MELIKYIGKRLSKNGKKQSWGLYLCPFCLQEVERRINTGKLCKSCGCMQYKLMAETNKGIKRSIEVKQKISTALQGNKNSLGIKRTEKQKNHLSKIKKGTKQTDKAKQKISDSLKGKTKELSRNWQNGKSFEEYPQEFYSIRNTILERDKYVWQCPDCEHKTDKLDVHHIDFNKKNNNPENLITLCRRCHSKTFGKNKKNFWIYYYQNIMVIKKC